MSLNKNYREEYSQTLKDFVLLEALNKRYSALEKEYDLLKKQINEELEKTDSLCTDCERLFDKATGVLKTTAQAVVGEAEVLKKNLLRLCEISAQKSEIEKESGFNDGLAFRLAVVLAISDYEKQEKQIIDELGKEQGERVIYEEKKKVAEFEKAYGVYFFGDAVAKTEEWYEIKVLYAKDGEITLTKENNFVEQTILLTSAQGVKIPFKKTAQTCYKGIIYLEIACLQERKIRGLNYYTVEQTPSGQKFVLVEDETLYEKLYDLCEIY